MRLQAAGYVCALSTLSASAKLLRSKPDFIEPDDVLPKLAAKAGDTFVGELKCQHANLGFRMEYITATNVTATVYPEPFWDWSSMTFCRPLVSCEADFNLIPAKQDGALGEDMMEYVPTPESTGALKECGYPVFGLKGTASSQGKKGTSVDKLDGAMTGLDKYAFKVRSDINRPEITKDVSHFCKLKEGAPSKTENTVYCSQYTAQKCTEQPPQKGEKVVHFVHQTVGDFHGNHDGGLTKWGKQVAMNLPHTFQLERAMSGFAKNRRHAAGKVFAGPNAKSMEIVLNSFHKLGMEVVLDPNLLTKQDQYTWNQDQDEKVLVDANATKMLANYREIRSSLTGPNLNSAEGNYDAAQAFGSNDRRLKRFKRRLLQEPGDNFIVIAHNGLYKDAKTIPTTIGGVDTRILTASGQWRAAGLTRCWS